MTDKSSKERGAFPVTRWSLVARACAPSGRSAPAALNELLQVYCPVLKKHLVRAMNFTPHGAEDLVQDFVARKIMEKRILDDADERKGRFRSYLLHVFTNFVISEIRRQKAKKCGPLNDRAVSLDEAPDLALEAAQAHRAFDLEWARQVMAMTIERMKTECDEKGRNDLWELFSCRVLGPALDQATPPSYEVLVRRFGFQSPSQASNCLITAKRMFRRALTDVVRDTVADESRVEEEIRELKAVLAG